MERYVLRAVYNSVFRRYDSPGDAVTNTAGGSDRFVAYKHKIRHYARLAIFRPILYKVFGEGSNSAQLSERIAILIMISEEHLKNDETLFQSVYGHGCSVNLRVQGMHITFCFCDFLFYGYPCITIENVML